MSLQWKSSDIRYGGLFILLLHSLLSPEFFMDLANPEHFSNCKLISTTHNFDFMVHQLIGDCRNPHQFLFHKFDILNVVTGLKVGTSVIYSLRDPLIKDLLAVTKQIFDNHLVDAISLLEVIRNES